MEGKQYELQESPPAWTQEAYCPPRRKCLLCCSVSWQWAEGGVPHLVLDWGGYSRVPPIWTRGWGTSWTWDGVPPTWTWDGYHPVSWMGYPPAWTWDGVPPPPGHLLWGKAPPWLLEWGNPPPVDLWWGLPPPPQSAGWGKPPPPEMWTDRHLWKQYLPSYFVRGR